MQLSTSLNLVTPSAQIESAAPVAQAAESTGLRVGRVSAQGDDNWVVQGLADGHGHRLRRAASCLLDPQVGDTVAWMPRMHGTGGSRATGWIVHVLERESGAAPSSISVAGGLRMNVSGEWALHSQSLKVETGDARVRAQDVRVGFGLLRMVGRAVQSTVRKTCWVGEEFSAVVHQWLQHSKTHRRHTEGMESAQAGTMNLRADRLARVEAPLVLTEGADLVKTRGAQIHFG